MKNVRMFLLFVVMAATSASAMAEWVRVHSNEKLNAYADPTTVRKKRNIVRVSTLFDFRTENVSTDGSTYLSIMRESEFNCTQNLQRMISYAIYSGKMGRGKVISSNIDPQDWQPVTKVALALDMMNYSCK